MGASFLEHIGNAEDPRIPGMVVYPLDEIRRVHARRCDRHNRRDGHARGNRRKIVSGKADYVLALKGNQEALKQDVALFFGDPALAAGCSCHDEEPQVGRGRIEERTIRAAADRLFRAHKTSER